MIIRTLMAQISFVIIAITTSVLIVFGIYRYYSNYQEMNNQLNDSHSQIAERLSISLRSPLYSFYGRGIKDVIISEMKTKIVMGIYIYETASKKSRYAFLKTSKGEIVPVEQLTLKKDWITATRKIVHNSEEIGTVHVLVTSLFMKERVLKELSSHILQVFILDFFLVTSVMFFLSKKFVNPISILTKATSNIAKGELEYPIKPFSSSNEIGLLAQSLSTMRNSIKRQISELATHRDQLEILVNERTGELKKTNEDLKQEIDERVRTEIVLQDLTSDLRDRVKELNCLYGISAIMEKPDRLLDDAVQEIVNLIPASWRYPEITCARIVIDEYEYKTNNFRETPWKQCSEIVVHSKVSGVLEIYYLEKKPDSDEGPFLKEERTLINAISERLGRIIEYKGFEKEKMNLQTQLLQSAKMASIGQLAAGVAHEINNPAGFVNSNLNTFADYQNDIHKVIELYRKLKSNLKKSSISIKFPAVILEQFEQITDLEEEVDLDYILKDIKDLVTDSREGTDRIKKIVADLKDFAHPGDDKANLIDINKNLDSTLNVAQNELKYKTTVTKKYGELPQIKCNSNQINQVFMNLFVNAAQAIEESGEIMIETMVVDQYVEIKIKDTGSGIPKENLSKIFDPFFTTKDVGRGTGLGLNICYNIIKNHNGIIDVESTIGKGTMFTIRLPMQLK